jgi:hypothetical protein
MTTPRKEAAGLINSFIELQIGYLDCKKCAIVCVDKIIQAVYAYDGSEKEVELWEKTKEEIENFKQHQ